MQKFLVRFLLPAVLFGAGILFLFTATGARPFLSYLMSAIFLGMGVAAVQYGWSNGKRGKP